MGKKAKQDPPPDDSPGQPHRKPHRKVNPNSLKNLRPPWKPGQSGNPGGNPAGWVKFSVVFRQKALKELQLGKEKTDYANALAERAFREAIGGNVQAMNLVTKVHDGDGVEERESGLAVVDFSQHLLAAEVSLGFASCPPGWQPSTPRWSPLSWTPRQREYITSPARFRIVTAGRRSGKTEVAKRYVVRAAMRGSPWPDGGRWAFCAPTWMQVKNIYWGDLKSLVPKDLLAAPPSESELSIRLKNGSTILCVGMDNPARIEGTDLDGVVLDEYGNMKAQAWTAAVRPMLTTRRGFAFVIGVPEGRNHYWDLWQNAQKEQDWSAHTWKSSDVLPADEIEAARRDMDDLTFRQEMEGEFVSFVGRAYYSFDSAKNCAALAYNPDAPLLLCFDFNVSPGVAAVVQEQKLPNGQEGTGVIGEVWIRQGSNTPLVCSRIIAAWGAHRGPVFCYGDASGGAKGTAKVQGSDWDLIRQILGGHFKGTLADGKTPRFQLQVPPANPAVRARLNAVNSRCCSAGGGVRLMVDPAKAPNVVKDFEGVRVKDDGSGEIDKAKDPMLSHVTDALGYLIERKFPVSGAREGSFSVPF